ncbi:MAG TPA: hypothetical protein ENK26_13260 [Gammaproteobacteria bacterium]|nr:hypothetical protein [Gammaproteobacteria bacterium]
MKTGFSKGLEWGWLLMGALTLLSASESWARGEITEMITESRPATPSSYVKNGVAYQWGLGNDVLIRGFVYQGKRYDYQRLADRVVVRRVDNPRARGERCSVFVETAGANLSYAPSYPPTTNAQGNCDMAAIISGDVVNLGALDVFSNAGERPDSVKNIERVDLIVSQGLKAAPSGALDQSGHVVIEKSGNNPVRMAAITALDANGDPAAYGPLVYVHSIHADSSQLRYGLVAPERELDFLATEDSDQPGRLAYSNSHHESMGMAFVSQAELGLAVGQKYYGFSIFPSDVDPSVHRLTDPSTFPRDSRDTQLTDPGDADFFAGFAVELEKSQPPVARDDSARTTPGVAVDVDLLANDSDPDGQGLTVTFISQPQHGSVVVTDGVATYRPNDDFNGTEIVDYRVEDASGDSATAKLVISVPAVLQGASSRIETGLRGHGAGSFDLLGLALLGGLVSLRRKRPGRA